MSPPEGLAELGERGFIERITPGCLVSTDQVVVGIGDDCAVVRAGEDRVQLVSTDLLVEGVHFRRGKISPSQLGAKALAVNLSDIAAMGGRAQHALVSIGVPPDLGLAYLDALYAGLKGMAARFEVNILGGDCTGSERDLVLNIAVVGEAAGHRVLLRRGAQVGDAIFVTGAVGDSGAGLDAILNGRDGRPEAEPLVERHLQPEPHLEAGQRIAATGLAHAMIDVSDGVARDLGHICDQSRVGCVLESRALPVSEALRGYAARHGLDAIQMALTGAEDYVLLCTADEALADALGPQIELTRIGHITADPQRRLDHAPLPTGGWDHFRERQPCK